ncbi:THUMP domain-containing protein 2 isoform X2 [Penaeus vannamei]|uniref:THUMP domain-containing protein 2 isoform X2 n=1 Tax=Penaeus vannamei TaxID=6689 RepID=UPI00387F9EBF
MSITLFATHGRGLDAFAQEEIHEKLTNVHNVQTLGEGKISFSIPLKSNDSKEDKGNDEEILIGAVSPVYDLKLVERIFILLHCETFDIGETHNESGRETDHTTDRKKKPTYNDESNNQLFKKYEKKLADIIDKEKWAKVAYQVQALRRFQEQRRARVQCQDPSNCHGSVRRRAEKQKLWQRRFSEETSCSEKRMMRESAHDLSEKRATESDIASSSDLAVGPLKERLTETGISEAREMSVAISELDASRMNYDVNSTSDASQKEMDGQEATDKVILEKRGIRTNNPEGTNGKSSKPEPQVNSENINCTSGFSNIENGISGISSISDVCKPDLDTYRETKNVIHENVVNYRVSSRISGVSLSRESLSLRPYIPHITLRSTVAYLMARLAQVPQGGVALDPMCGGGTILLEMAKCFEVGLIIGGDVSQEQLRISRCNLQDVGVPFSLLRMDAAAMPLMSQSVNAIVCDVPFGQKHQLKDENESTMLRELLCECQRVLKCSGRLVLLISTRQLEILRKIMPCLSSFQHTVLAEEQETSQLKLDATYQVSLGETSAHIAVLQKLPCK